MLYTVTAPNITPQRIYKRSSDSSRTWLINDLKIGDNLFPFHIGGKQQQQQHMLDWSKNEAIRYQQY